MKIGLPNHALQVTVAAPGSLEIGGRHNAELGRQALLSS
jgi:hypothetical protein